MKKFISEEKDLITTAVQQAFLDVVGKRYHTCYWESLVLKEVLSWIDPDEIYQTCWALTWFVSEAPPEIGRERHVAWAFEDTYRASVKQRGRLPFYEEYEQRMAHNYVLVNPGRDAIIIDISTGYHIKLLKTDLGIDWQYDDPYVWQTFASLPKALQHWYRPAEIVTHTEHQNPPPGLIDEVFAEAKRRLTGLV